MTKWYGAKTIYRTSRTGIPTVPDDDALRAAAAVGAPILGGEAPDDSGSGATLVEERVVLFRASSQEMAIERAEQDAQKYVSGNVFNAYGQQLLSRALEYVEVYELSVEPTDGAEVFSRTYLCNSDVSDDDVVDDLCPEDAFRSEVRELFEPNLSQTARRKEDEGDEGNRRT